MWLTADEIFAWLSLDDTVFGLMSAAFEKQPQVFGVVLGILGALNRAW